MFSCAETMKIDTQKGIQFNISLAYDGIFGCASKRGQSVLFELTSDNRIHVQISGGGSKLNISFNSTGVECWSGSIKKITNGIVSCQSVFGGSINIDMAMDGTDSKNPSSLSTAAIVCIVMAVLIVVCAIVFIVICYCQHGQR